MDPSGKSAMAGLAHLPSDALSEHTEYSKSSGPITSVMYAGVGSEAVHGQLASRKGRKKVPPVDLDQVTDPEERKRQRRLMKNRETAAASRYEVMGWEGSRERA